jgi:asparagine synthase (glutamine-hydrolysing)
LPFAKKALKELNADASIIYTDSTNLFDNIFADTQFFDDITGSPLTAITGIYKAMKNKGISVSMDGHGADEYLFGYRSMVMDLFYKSQLYQGKKYSKRLAKVLLRMYHPDEQSDLKQTLKDQMKNAYTFPNYIKRLARNTFMPEFPEQNIALNHLFKSPLPSLLKNFDKASMKHGVEIRMPFMDYRLIEMCYNLENRYKLNHGQTKWIVRDELKNIMPPSTLARNYKIGVQAPVEKWLAGEHKHKFEALLHDGHHKDLIPKEFLNAKDKNYQQYWHFLNLQMIDL